MALLGALAAACSTAPPEGVTPVRDFDVERYLGTWHEVARLDHRFERGLVAVTAEYALREDGGLSVTNTGFDVDEGAWDVAEGKAYFTSDPDVASLKVSFFGPFYGGYHVLALDRAAPDYGYAMISGPDRGYLWILARDPALPPATLDGLVGRAADLGFPVDELIFVEAAPPAGAPPRP